MRLVPAWLCEGLTGPLGGDCCVWRLRAPCAFLGGKAARAVCAHGFPAMVNINEAVGARPSGRPTPFGPPVPTSSQLACGQRGHPELPACSEEALLGERPPSLPGHLLIPDHWPGGRPPLAWPSTLSWDVLPFTDGKTETGCPPLTPDLGLWGRVGARSPAGCRDPPWGVWGFGKGLRPPSGGPGPGVTQLQ